MRTDLLQASIAPAMTSGALTRMKRDLTLRNVISHAREADTNTASFTKGAKTGNDDERRLHGQRWKTDPGTARWYDDRATEYFN